jgi:hypothetical protein
MFTSILRIQWGWSRLVVVLGVIVCFLLPVLTVQQVGLIAADDWLIWRLLDRVAFWGVWYAALAATLGLLLATYAWAADHHGKHVYALSLPIPRWYYVLLRFGAGLVLIAAPILALWLSAVIATAVAPIPQGLQAYPHTLAVRFALAAFISYSVFFAISSATTRTAAIILVGVAGIILSQVLLGIAGSESDFALHMFDRLVEWPGPLQIFTGRWMLIDV